MLTRRAFLNGAMGLAGASVLALSHAFPRLARAGEGLPLRPEPAGGRRHDLSFAAHEHDARLLGSAGPLSRVWTYGDGLLPVVRVRIGDSIRAVLSNRLPQHTSIHWHGVRVPNAMDGVQYVTQPPVEPGADFTYEFTPPDTGTFFFHPHCDEPGQVGRGLAGILIVEGDEPSPSDADVVMAYKDWRLADDGSWLPFVTAEGASRAGTFGTLRTVNAVPGFSADVPAHGDIRLRVLNLDATRMIDLGVEGAEAYVIATDGNPVDPFPLKTWRVGAAMRVDLLVRAPGEGGSFSVNDYFTAEPWRLGRFTAVASGKAARAFAPQALFASRIPRADLATAERIPFAFSASAGSSASVIGDLPPDDPLAKVLLDSLCVGSKTFWAINKSTWPGGDHRALPPPLGTLTAGRSYVFELMNATPHPHPIHLHGHTFEVLSASRQDLPRFLADTVLLQPKERIEIAFVAQRGDWMFHCHVLEHLEGGMMGWLRVT
jgi:FtsP/CotA-like multicopper oxidase with cupredoxin domain